MVPAWLIVAVRTTEPSIRAFLANGGYVGSTRRIRLPCNMLDVRNVGGKDRGGIAGMSLVPVIGIGKPGPDPIPGPESPIGSPTLPIGTDVRSEEHTSELQSPCN